MEKEYSFFATLEANVFLSDSEFYAIWDCMKRHYDITVQMSIEVGGFMYGLNNRRTLSKHRAVTDEDRICDFSNREIQLMLKSLEMTNGDNFVSDIRNKLRDILTKMSKKQNEINENLNN